MADYLRANKDQLKTGKMRKDVVERFQWNMANYEDPFDRDEVIKMYSDFEATFLLEGDLNHDDPKFVEDIEFVSKELKKMAESVLDEIFANIKYSSSM